MIPEAYRQRLRKYRKLEIQTYTDFLRQMEAYFEQSNLEKEVGRDDDESKQLILIKEFKNGLSEELKLYLDDTTYRKYL